VTAAGDAAAQLESALLGVEGVVDVRVNLQTYLDPSVLFVAPLLVPDDAVRVADRLAFDGVDRVEVAAVVEAIADLHARATVPDWIGRPHDVCLLCTSPDIVPWPCQTRRLLAELPGGAL
jgi:hypothetical protein